MSGSSRLAVVTGVLGGIGAAIAEAFERDGWRVVGIDRREAAGDAVPEATVVGDVSVPDDSARIFETIGRVHGRITALVNNAAVQLVRSIQETTPEEWDGVMANNVRSVFLSIRNALPHFDEGAAIVNVSSVHALASSNEVSAYAASKGAVLALSRQLAVELASRGIRVNAVLPGATDTPMLRAGLRKGERGALDEQTAYEALADRHPLRRIAQPAEMGRLVAFLADSERAGFITGQGFVADGGALARLSTE